MTSMSSAGAAIAAIRRRTGAAMRHQADQQHQSEDRFHHHREPSFHRAANQPRTY